jgi:hypothetical protein
MDEGMETCSGDILGDEEEVEQVNMAMEMGGSSVGLVSPLLMGAPSPLQPAPTPPAATPSSSQMELSILDPALPKREPSAKYLKERDICMGHFQYWNEQDQIDFVEELLLSMHHHQHGTVNAFLKPMLQRDFISLLPKKGLDHVAENVLLP